MKSLLSRILFPVSVMTMAVTGTLGLSERAGSGTMVGSLPLPVITEVQDTVKYPHDGYKKLWTEEDYRMSAGAVSDTLTDGSDSLVVEGDAEIQLDSTPVIHFRDTVHIPDSLKFTDPFRYKYYAALVDSATHVWVRDTLKAAGDTLDWVRLDSLYYADSTALAKAAFDAWYAGLDKNERKKYDMEQLAKRKLAQMDSIKVAKDSLQAIKDSILENTPRILETFALNDSLLYKRIVSWTHDRHFHNMDVQPLDTGFNYRFHDYPFKRDDIGATWLGVAGSPALPYNFFNRKSREGVSFYDTQEIWSWSPETLPFYNTKTPYTELGYTGTLFSGTEKESDNIHILTTQNINPDLNFALGYDRFGGNGMLQNESTANKNFFANINKLGKRYLGHAGYIYNKVSRSENGGLTDNYWVRDTVVDAREINVALKDASSLIKKNTLFLDQQYRIPFTFLQKIKNKGDTTAVDDGDVTTAFIGHSTEYSTYRRLYSDKGGTAVSNFYNGAFYYNPKSTSDSLRVSKLENRFFIRLQPWSEDAIVSKLDVGIGDRLLKYYTMDPTYLTTGTDTRWNSVYLYAGAKGQFRDYIHWDAKGDYVFLGNEFSDLNIEANAGLNLYPFRRARKSPLSVEAHFETSLDEPDFYTQHLLTNHFKWDNDFKKISTTKIQGSIDIPHWDLKATAGYALLDGNIYYDTLGIVRQNNIPMSVLSVTLDKNFVIGRMFHLEHRGLFQLSSNQDVLPLPKLALNARYYLELAIAHNVMHLQLGLDGYWNTAWYSPAYNPALGVFRNQTEQKYNSGPYVDAFVNVQWKRACIFVKYENAGRGILMDKDDYFSAHHYINTQPALKIGIYWPFYRQPNPHGTAAAYSSSSGQSQSSSSSAGLPRGAGDGATRQATSGMRMSKD